MNDNKLNKVLKNKIHFITYANDKFKVAKKEY